LSSSSCAPPVLVAGNELDGNRPGCDGRGLPSHYNAPVGFMASSVSVMVSDLRA